MRAATFISVLLTLFAVSTGCERGPKLTKQLRFAGRAAALKQECVGFIQIFVDSKDREYVWMASKTNFPPTIALFKPHAVLIERQGGILMVDLRISGGFMHHGLLVAPTAPPSGFIPRMSNWPVWKIADGVWEYRE